MVTRRITYPMTDTFSAIVIESIFSLLPHGRYLLEWTTLNRYPWRCSIKHFFFPTSSGSISIARHRVSLVTIPFIDFIDSLNSVNSLLHISVVKYFLHWTVVAGHALGGGVLFFRNFAKFLWGPDFVEFVLGSFSCFNIEIACSNFTFCSS